MIRMETDEEVDDLPEWNPVYLDRIPAGSERDNNE